MFNDATFFFLENASLEFSEFFFRYLRLSLGIRMGTRQYPIVGSEYTILGLFLAACSLRLISSPSSSSLSSSCSGKIYALRFFSGLFPLSCGPYRLLSTPLIVVHRPSVRNLCACCGLTTPFPLLAGLRHLAVPFS